MADYRFKIQGSASPFLIQLSAGTTSVCETVFEYSGNTVNVFDPLKAYTCAVLGELEFDTEYNMRITNCVGNVYPTGETITFKTPVAPIPIFTNINVSLLSGGTDNSVDCNNILIEPKYMEITPPLTSGQCMRVCFCGCSTDGLHDTALIEVFKRCGAGGSYSRFLYIEDDNDDCYADMGVGDAVCYNMTASLVHDTSSQSYSYACTDLCVCEVTNLINVDSVTCSNIHLSVSETCCTTTTTTTTVAAPTTIAWGIPIITASAFTERKTTPLTINPALEAGQSFRLCFYNKAYYCFDTYLSQPVNSHGYELNGATKVACATYVAETLTGGPFSRAVEERGYIDVTCDNIDNIASCVEAISHVSNDGLDHVVCSCTRLNSISNAVGGSYIISHALSEVSASVIISAGEAPPEGGGGLPPE